MKKSVLVQLFLSLFFGPLGLFYSSIIVAIVYFAISIVIALLTGGLGLLIIWPLAILIGLVTVIWHNKVVHTKILAQEDQRHQEILQATKQAAENRP